MNDQIQFEPEYFFQANQNETVRLMYKVVYQPKEKSIVLLLIVKNTFLLFRFILMYLIYKVVDKRSWIERNPVFTVVCTCLLCTLVNGIFHIIAAIIQN